VGKSRQEIEEALELGVYSFNIESEAELDYIDQIAGAKNLRARIAFRANPDVDPHTHQYISTGTHENKFGIGLDRLSAVYERAAKMRNVEIVGLQMHIGSQITEKEPFAEAVAKVAPLVRELKSKYGIEFFSIGGGLGIVYESTIASGSTQWWDLKKPREQLSIQQYVDALLPPLRELNMKILLEPGRLLVGNAGVLLTRVRYIKSSGQKKFAIVDAGMNDLIRPALYHSYHEIVPVERARTETVETLDIVGPVCESGDFFALDREMPPLRAGDLLAIMSAGAYGFVMASNYNSRPLPAEALVRGDRFALIRARQTLEDLVRDEVDPDW
jgi:diaminopimelate decarboxylase